MNHALGKTTAQTSRSPRWPNVQTWQQLLPLPGERAGVRASVKPIISKVFDHPRRSFANLRFMRGGCTPTPFPVELGIWSCFTTGTAKAPVVLSLLAVFADNPLLRVIFTKHQPPVFVNDPILVGQRWQQAAHLNACLL